MRPLMNISRPLPVVLLLTTCLLSGSGCGGNDKIVAVTGKVTHEGKPVAGMIVSFVPQMQTESGTSTGETDENGEYSLTVFNTGQSGAVVGTHKVWVSLPHEPVEPVDKEDRMEKMRVEKKTKKRRSPATETLPPDTAQILKKYGRLDKTPLTVEVMGGPIDLKLD